MNAKTLLNKLGVMILGQNDAPPTVIEHLGGAAKLTQATSEKTLPLVTDRLGPIQLNEHCWN